MTTRETCAYCKDVGEVSEVAMARTGSTEPDELPPWAARLVRVEPSTLQCPDCGTRYAETYDQTHDHWWNDSWTVLTRLRDDEP